MTDDQKVAHAIGFLRGISAIIWNIDGENRNLEIGAEYAAYFDEQVDILARALLFEQKGDGDGVPD